MDTRELGQYCRDWVDWTRTRRFYMQPPAKNVLARLQPTKLGREPNARNHADMSYFNMAVHTLADMKEHQARYAAFYAYYMNDDIVIKRLAARLGIGRQTLYDRVNRFAQDAYSMSLSLKRAAQQCDAQSDTMRDASFPDDLPCRHD